MFGIDIDDALLGRKPTILLLNYLIVIEGLGTVNLPLAFGLLGAGCALGISRGGHGVDLNLPFLSIERQPTRLNQTDKAVFFIFK